MDLAVDEFMASLLRGLDLWGCSLPADQTCDQIAGIPSGNRLCAHSTVCFHTSDVSQPCGLVGCLLQPLVVTFGSSW